MIHPRIPAALLAAAVVAGPAIARPPVFYPREGGYPFSEAVQAGDVLYLSGIIPEGADGKVDEGPMEVQARRVMDLLGQALARRGLGYDAVIQCTVMLTDMNDWPAFNAVYRESFRPGRYPARAAFGAAGLALGARVELQCNAWNPSRR